MDHYTQVEETGRTGRPVTTLPVNLFNEYKKYMIKTSDVKTYQRTTSQMLAELREMAGDRVKWQDIVTNICQL